MRDIEEFSDEEPHLEERDIRFKDHEKHSLTTEERDEIIRKHNADHSFVNDRGPPVEIKSYTISTKEELHLAFSQNPKMFFRESATKEYDHAKNIADFLLNHENLPEDMVPYWDFNAPNIPDEPRDASAAAILCSGLYELSTHLGDEGDEYKLAADKILQSLSSDKYRAGIGENNNFILMHSVGHLPNDSEVDVPIIYADYYFIEACIRKLDLESYN